MKDKKKSPNYLRCIGIVSPIRSGGNLLNRLLDSHPQLVTNHSENFLSVYTTRNDQLEKKISKFKKKNSWQIR